MQNIFLRENVIDAATAHRWRAAMLDGVPLEARVSRAGVLMVDPHFRRSSSIVVPESVSLDVMNVLESLREPLQGYFGHRLGQCQPPVFLHYRPGDFFRPHSDNSGDPRQAAHILARDVTIVLFLNSSCPTVAKDDPSRPGEFFSGGELVLYNAMDEPTWDHFHDSVPARIGRLVAFRADLHHEVTEVREGTRFSIATWFEFPGDRGPG
jgi:predicted 2-oxoglutarate/Fe(II)-dependent dioxygenase YbiX